MKRVLMLVAMSFCLAGPAFAQTCFGGLEFSDPSLHVGGGLAFTSDSRAFSGGVAKGNDSLFFHGAATLASFSGLDGTTKAIEGQVGTERVMGASKKLHVCPQVSVLKTWGPEPGPDFKYSELLLSFGGNVGFEAAQSGTTRIVPTFGFAFNHLRSSLSTTDDAFGEGGSFGDSFATLQLGVGLLFNDKMALTPTIFIPVGSDDAQTAFSVIFATTLKKN